MKLTASIMQPLVDGLIGSTVKLAAGWSPSVVLLQMADTVHEVEDCEDLSGPLRGLQALIQRAEDPQSVKLNFDEVREGLGEAIDQLRQPAEQVNSDLANLLAFAHRRWRSLSKPLSSQPIEAKRFSDTPPVTPMHVSIPPVSRPPNIAEWPQEDAQLTPQFLRKFIGSFMDPMGIWELTKEGKVRVVMINPTLTKVAGYDEADITDIDLNRFFHPDDLGKFKEVRKHVAEHGYGFSQQFLRVIDGEQNERWVDLHIAFLGDGPKGYFMLLDQTARHIAQEENATLRQAYRNARRATSIFILPRRGPLRVLLNNRSLEKVLGYEPGEMTANNMTLSEFFPRETRIQSLKWLLKGIRNKELEGQDINMLHKNGSVIPFDIEADISESGDDMFAVVTFTPSDQREMTERMKALELIIPGLAHDFNNALTIVGGETELLRRKLDDPVYADRDSLLENTAVITKGHQFLRDHIRRLQGLASSRGREEDRSPAEIEELIHPGLVQAAVGHDVEVDFKVDENAWAVMGPVDHLWQAVSNILLNAKDAMAGSGVKFIQLSVQNVVIREEELARLQIRSRYRNVRPGDFMKISIRDTGHGIPRAKLNKIFEPYHTTKDRPSQLSHVLDTTPSAESATPGARKAVHPGLGLWNTHMIISERGGFIHVESKEGEGTTFELFLPRAETVGHTSTAPSSPENAVGVVLTVGDAEKQQAYRAVNHSLQMKSVAYVSIGSLEEAMDLLRQRSDVRAVVVHLPEAMPSIQDAIVDMRRVRSNLPVMIVSSAEVDIEEDPITVSVKERFRPDGLVADIHRITKLSD